MNGSKKGSTRNGTGSGTRTATGTTGVIDTSNIPCAVSSMNSSELANVAARSEGVSPCWTSATMWPGRMGRDCAAEGLGKRRLRADYRPPGCQQRPGPRRIEPFPPGGPGSNCSDQPRRERGRGHHDKLPSAKARRCPHAGGKPQREQTKELPDASPPPPHPPA